VPERPLDSAICCRLQSRRIKLVAGKLSVRAARRQYLRGEQRQRRENDQQGNGTGRATIAMRGQSSVPDRSRCRQANHQKLC
jgi:hypothetical protein